MKRYLPVMLGAVLLLTGCAAQPLPDDAPVSDAAQTETPADLETMPETQTAQAETAAPPTEEVTEQETLWDFSGEQHDGWKRAYREFLCGNDYTTLLDSDYKDYRFLLFCLDDDAIPELVIRGDMESALYRYNEETGEVVFVDTFPAQGHYGETFFLPGGGAIACDRGSVMTEGASTLVKVYEMQEGALKLSHSYNLPNRPEEAEWIDFGGDPYETEDLLALHLVQDGERYRLDEAYWVAPCSSYTPLSYESFKENFE